MRYYYSKEYATLFYMEDGNLAGMPPFADGVFNTDDSFIVEMDNDEIPEGFYAGIIERLKEKPMATV